MAILEAGRKPKFHFFNQVRSCLYCCDHSTVIRLRTARNPGPSIGELKTDHGASTCELMIH